MTPELAADSEHVLLGVAMSGTAGHRRKGRASHPPPTGGSAGAGRAARGQLALGDDGSLILLAGLPFRRRRMIAAIEAQLPATLR